MVSPGEPIERIVSRFSIDQLKEFMGQEIYSSLKGIVPPGNLRASLEKICAGILEDDGYRYLSEPENRRLVHSNLSSEKFDELLARLAYEGEKDDLYLVGIENDDATFSRYLGFFGLLSSDFKAPPASLPIQRIRPEYSLFEHQRSAMLKVWSYVSRGRPVVLHMPTGSGKTRTSMHLVAHYLKEEEPGVVLL